jgi:hypothetical protein
LPQPKGHGWAAAAEAVKLAISFLMRKPRR